MFVSPHGMSGKGHWSTGMIDHIAGRVCRDGGDALGRGFDPANYVGDLYRTYLQLGDIGTSR